MELLGINDSSQMDNATSRRVASANGQERKREQLSIDKVDLKFKPGLFKKM